MTTTPTTLGGASGSHSRERSPHNAGNEEGNIMRRAIKGGAIIVAATIAWGGVLKAEGKEVRSWQVPETEQFEAYRTGRVTPIVANEVVVLTGGAKLYSQPDTQSNSYYFLHHWNNTAEVIGKNEVDMMHRPLKIIDPDGDVWYGAREDADIPRGSTANSKVLGANVVAGYYEWFDDTAQSSKVQVRTSTDTSAPAEFSVTMNSDGVMLLSGSTESQANATSFTASQWQQEQSILSGFKQAPLPTTAPTQPK